MLDCAMRSQFVPFCAVCRETLVLSIYRKARPIDKLSPASPALSVAGDVLAMSVYRSGEYQIVKMRVPRAPIAAAVPAAATPRSADTSPASPGLGADGLEHLVPQIEPFGGVVFGSGDDPDQRPRRSDLVRQLADRSFLVKPYRRKMSLEGIGEPYVSAGSGRVGSFIQAGMSALFGDMLGDHQLSTIVQLNSGLTNNFSAKNTAAPM